MGFSIAENFCHTLLLSNLNFYASTYISHSFHISQKTSCYKLYNFFKLAFFLFAPSAISILVRPSLMLSFFS
uniref:Uncharacterized protein n=1 Tax=uncultured marine crenarchaeote HF4000_APKG8G15 TaxID=455605 RepID=B3TAU0_9ARCH|nr:hypothetical protein ALOHA_HF4000APKG8G15ctg1g38 [uncultured marine crenarchaeote HF4000_APKG8G15]